MLIYDFEGSAILHPDVALLVYVALSAANPVLAMGSPPLTLLMTFTWPDLAVYPILNSGISI